MQIIIKLPYKLIPLILVGMWAWRDLPKLPKITSLQNLSNILEKSVGVAIHVLLLQYLKKNSSYKVNALHADKHDSLFLVDSINLMGLARHVQSNLQYL